MSAIAFAPAVAYTDTDRQVWRTLYERQRLLLPGMSTEAFAEGVHQVGLVADHIPQLAALTERFRALTGWTFEPVDGIVDDRVFFELIAERRFPITTWLRAPEQLDYLEQPDFFHDCYGHVPLLAHEAFSDFLQGMAEAFRPYLGRPTMVELLTRLYWFTVEFGLIYEPSSTGDDDAPGALRIYGAGILSSVGETAYSLGEVPERRAFDLQQVMATPFHKDRYQDVYFVVPSYDALYASLRELKSLLPRLARVADEAHRQAEVEAIAPHARGADAAGLRAPELATH